MCPSSSMAIYGGRQWSRRSGFVGPVGYFLPGKRGRPSGKAKEAHASIAYCNFHETSDYCDIIWWKSQRMMDISDLERRCGNASSTGLHSQFVLLNWPLLVSCPLQHTKSDSYLRSTHQNLAIGSTSEGTTRIVTRPLSPER